MSASITLRSGKRATSAREGYFYFLRMFNILVSLQTLMMKEYLMDVVEEIRTEPTHIIYIHYKDRTALEP